MEQSPSRAALHEAGSIGGANLLDISITNQGCGIPLASGGDPLEGRAAAIIFTDGFESGDTSAWSN